ncbi:hypothetical protein HDV06_004567 [Boothiomyces sp. JEL0866]|nr:hypothetical protein HDV06_004567 [Boothiomyces sp. JEL0866]
MIFKNKFGAIVPEMLQVKDCFDSNDCIECIALPLDKVKRKLSEDAAPKKRPNLNQIIPDSQVRMSPRIQLESPISDSNILLLDKIRSNEKETSLVDQIFESDKESLSTTSKISGYQSDEDVSETDETKTSENQIVNETANVSEDDKGATVFVDLQTQENNVKEVSANEEIEVDSSEKNLNESFDAPSQLFDTNGGEERQELDEEVNFLIKDTNLAPTPRTKVSVEGEPEKKKGRRAKKKELLKSLEFNSQNKEASQMSEILGNGMVSPVLTSNSKVSPKKLKKSTPVKPKPLKLFGDEIADLFELGSESHLESSEEFKVKSVNMEDTPTQEGLTQSSPIDVKLGSLFSDNDEMLDKTLPPSKQPSSLKVVSDTNSIPENALFDSQPLSNTQKSKASAPRSQKLSSLPVLKKAKAEIVNPFSSIKQGQKFRSLSQIAAEVVPNKHSQISLVSTNESSSGESGGDSDSSSDSDTEKSAIKMAGKKKSKRRKSMLLELAKEVKPGAKSRRSLPANAKINK